jgi:hypothetical protein
LTEASELVAGASGYRALGVIDNPFKARHQGLGQAGAGVALEAHAAAARAVAAIDAVARGDDTAPVLVRKSPTVPTYYNMAGVAETTFTLADNDEVDVLGLYIPLVQMKTGRIRSAVNAISERMAEDQFDRTLAIYTAALLAEPDESLPEWEGIADLDREALIAELEENPIGTVERYFGACESVHRDTPPVEVVISDSVVRARDLESDPEQGDEADEDVPLPEGYIAPVAMSDDEMAHLMGLDDEPGGENAALEGATEAATEGATEGEEGPEEEPEPQKTPEDLLVDYVVAHTKAHLSPVIARGIAGYRNSGTVSTAQEWKITKAPRKTLAALSKLAAYRYRRVVVMWDQFDAWNQGMHEDWKIKILSAFTEMRFAMGENGLLVLMVQEGQAPEIEQQFGTGVVVDWSMPELERLRADQDLLDPEIVRSWVAAATVSDGDGEPLNGLDPLIEAADGSLERFQRMASAAVEDAAARGVSSIDDEAVAAARATGD